MAKVLKEYREKNKDKKKSANNTITKLVANNPVYDNEY